MKSKKYTYAAAGWLVKQLDMMVEDPKSSEYQELRAELLYRMNRAEVKNPFKAGAPSKYEEKDEIKATELKKRGLTTRQIASEMGCSQSTVIRLLNKRYK